jgi:hypothetical protein
MRCTAISRKVESVQAYNEVGGVSYVLRDCDVNIVFMISRVIRSNNDLEGNIPFVSDIMGHPNRREATPAKLVDYTVMAISIDALKDFPDANGVKGPFNVLFHGFGAVLYLKTFEGSSFVLIA